MKLLIIAYLGVTIFLGSILSYKGNASHGAEMNMVALEFGDADEKGHP